MTTHTRIRSFAARMLWLIGLTAFLVMTVPWQQGLAQPGEGLELGSPHFSPGDLGRPIIGTLRKPIDKLPQIKKFKVVGETIITNPGETIERGRNGGIAIANDCLYVASRVNSRTGTPRGSTKPEIAIVDISDPRRPQVVGHLSTIFNAVNREIRAFGAPLNTLFVQHFGSGVPDSPTVNNIQIYDVSQCRNPQLTDTITLKGPFGAGGPARPHEFFVWRDPNDSGRILVYVSFAQVPDLRVYEVLDAPNPSNSSIISTPIATFTLDPAVDIAGPVDPARWDPAHTDGGTRVADGFSSNRPTSRSTNAHSMSVSADGTRVYVAGRGGAGFYIIDSSPLAANISCVPNTVTFDETSNDPAVNPNLCLRKINPRPFAGINLIPPYRSINHTVVPVPGRPYFLTGGERNGTNTCPWTWGMVVHIVDETNPQIVSQFMLPENLVENCFLGGPGDPAHEREFSSHQITAFENLFFISWYAGGLRAWDIFNPKLPLEVGVFVPKPRAEVVERFRDSPDVWVWPYPVVHDGLVYIADENGGLYILEYTGPRADELPQEGTFQGNAT